MKPVPIPEFTYGSRARLKVGDLFRVRGGGSKYHGERTGVFNS